MRADPPPPDGREGDTPVDVRVQRLADDRALLTVRGDLDLHTAHRLGDVLQPLLSGDEHMVLVDLSAVTFLDSTGLTMLISAYRTARSTGARLALIAPSPPVREMLRLTGVDRVVDAYPSPDAVPR
ncbi:STAS domain-containing protein [Streptomyces achromogenes]|uniref:STAS domain-containing protein n=1 Tax=Streptomyces achromogenes TaxID=67255 RepID=UPI0033F99F13